MSLIINDQVIVGPGNSPYVGENGNWFIGTTDTGYYAGTDIYYKSVEEFNTCYNEGIYYVYDSGLNTMETWFIDDSGGKRVIAAQNVLVPVVGENGNWFLGQTDLGIPATGDGSTIAGAAIDDDSIDASTAWSSYKIRTELDSLKGDGIPGKNLEFAWSGNKLGVRQEGSEEYLYTDLSGAQGLAGLDGSSILDARINDEGHLIVKVQDEEDSRATHQILSFESGVFTKSDLTTLQNSINRLNREIYNIKSSQLRQIVPVNHNTDGEYERVFKFDGSGNCQVLVSQFTGSIKIGVDGAVYTVTNNDITNMAESSLVSLNANNKLVLLGLFDGNEARGLDIPFKTVLTVDVLVNDNDTDTYPRFLIQGTCYYSSPDNPDGEGGGDYIPDYDAMSVEDVDAMMGLS